MQMVFTFDLTTTIATQYCRAEIVNKSRCEEFITFWRWIELAKLVTFVLVQTLAIEEV